MRAGGRKKPRAGGRDNKTREANTVAAAAALLGDGAAAAAALLSNGAATAAAPLGDGAAAVKSGEQRVTRGSDTVGLLATLAAG